MRIQLALGLVLFTSCAPPSAVVFVQDPDRIADGADALVLSIDGDEIDRLVLDPPGVGTQVSLTLAHDVEGARRTLLIEATAGGETVARAFVEVTLTRDDAQYFAQLRPVCPGAEDGTACTLDDGSGDGVCLAERCTLTACGDGIVSGAEECDEAGLVDLLCVYGDLACERCAADCTLVAGQTQVCGDGELQPSDEECDDGNDLSGDGCDAACRKEACGDGLVQPGEECDDPDGNESNPARGGCRLDCSEARCGDGIVDADEACDDDNVMAGDGCSAICEVETCGDGVVNNAGTEECDDGAGNVTMGMIGDCRASCARISCGDGITDLDEQCDDGNTSEVDGCLNDCTIARCGDEKIREGVEECETSDAVTAACAYGDLSCTVCDAELCINVPGATSYCGDGVLDQDADEVCDDGNAESFDGCSSSCSYVIWDVTPGAAIPADVGLITDTVHAGLALFPDGVPDRLIIPDAMGVLRSLNGSTGEVQWAYDMGAPPMGGAQSWSSNLMVLGNDGRLHILLESGPDAPPADAGVGSSDAGDSGLIDAGGDGGAFVEAGPADAGPPPPVRVRISEMRVDGGLVAPATDFIFGVYFSQVIGVDGSLWTNFGGQLNQPLRDVYLSRTGEYDSVCPGCELCKAPGCRPSHLTIGGLVVHVPTSSRLVRFGPDCQVDFELEADAGIRGVVASLSNLDNEINEGEVSVAVLGDGRAVFMPPVTVDAPDGGCGPANLEPTYLGRPATALPDGGSAPAHLTSHPILFPLQGVSAIAAAKHGALVRFPARPGDGIAQLLMQDMSVTFQPYLTLDAEGYVYAADGDGRLYKVHGVSGQVAWVRDFELGSLSNSVIVGADAVFVSTTDGRVLALEGGGTTVPAAGAWSRESGNNFGVNGGGCSSVTPTPFGGLFVLLHLLGGRRRASRRAKRHAGLRA